METVLSLPFGLGQLFQFVSVDVYIDLRQVVESMPHMVSPFHSHGRIEGTEESQTGRVSPPRAEESIRQCRTKILEHMRL